MTLDWCNFVPATLQYTGAMLQLMLPHPHSFWGWSWKEIHRLLKALYAWKSAHISSSLTKSSPMHSTLRHPNINNWTPDITDNCLHAITRVRTWSKECYYWIQYKTSERRLPFQRKQSTVMAVQSCLLGMALKQKICLLAQTLVQGYIPIKIMDIGEVK